jgi:GR25 family glycosyltransferase involved in LPS biosynthesis
MISGAKLDDLPQLVPRMELQAEGNTDQALGLDLPILGINLLRRPDRWQMLTERMAKVGLTRITRAPAVEGAKLPDNVIAALLQTSTNDIDAAPSSHLTLTRPAIGCFLSHMAIWRWVLETNTPRVLVFEDDAAPAVDFDPDNFRRIVSSLPDDAGLVFPGCLIMAGLAERPAARSPLGRLYYYNGTFGYLVTPAAARTLLQHLLPLQRHLDHQMSRMFIESRNDFVAYYTDPQFFTPDWTLRSDIYIPLDNEAAADKELDRLIQDTRRTLLAEGRPLLPENP